MKYRLWIIILALSLVVGTPALAQEDWAGFIAAHFPLETAPGIFHGPLAVIEEMPGQALDGEMTAQGVTLRTHYAAFDGVQLLVLFSLEGETVNSVQWAANLLEDTSTRGAGWWRDEESGRLYGLMSALAMDPSKLAAETLLRVRDESAPEQRVTIGAMYSGNSLWGPEVNEAVDLTGVAARSLVFYDFTVENGKLHMRYSLLQDEENPLNTYLVVVTQENGYKRLSVPLYIDGEAEMTVDLPEDEYALVMLASDKNASLRDALFTGWSLPVPLEGYDDPPIPVVEQSLNIKRSFTAPQEQDAELSQLAQIERMLQGAVATEKMESLVLTLDKAVSYQTGALLLYEITVADPEAGITMDDFSTMMRAWLEGNTFEWQTGAENFYTTWFGISFGSVDGGPQYANGYASLSQGFQTGDEPLNLLISYPQLEGDDITIPFHTPQ